MPVNQLVWMHSGAEGALALVQTRQVHSFLQALLQVG